MARKKVVELPKKQEKVTDPRLKDSIFKATFGILTSDLLLTLKKFHNTIATKKTIDHAKVMMFNRNLDNSDDDICKLIKQFCGFPVRLRYVNWFKEETIIDNEGLETHVGGCFYVIEKVAKTIG